MLLLREHTNSDKESLITVVHKHKNFQSQKAFKKKALRNTAKNTVVE